MEEFLGQTEQVEAATVSAGRKVILFGFEYFVVEVSIGGEFDQLRVFTLDSPEREYRGTPVVLTVHEQLGILVPA